MDQNFSIDHYYSHLKTRNLGRPCNYLEVVESTIEVASKSALNTIVIAREQLKGRGQRSNVWQSPVGCLMASIKLGCNKLSPLGKRLCFLQHIMVLVAARTMEQIDGQKLGKKNIKFKWPNDIIYINPTTSQSLKIGGVLVNTVEQGGEFDVTLSFGLNIFNREPTTCISEIIGSSKPLRMDEVVADMMNNLEQCTYELNEEKFQQLKDEYNQRCLHIGQLVKDEVNGLVKAREVDDDGYLIGVKHLDKTFCKITKIVG